MLPRSVLALWWTILMLHAGGPAVAVSSAGDAEDDVRRIVGWIDALGSADYHEREAATTHLIRAGSAALPYLEAAARDADPERARRASHLLKVVGKIEMLAELQGEWVYETIENNGVANEKAVGATLSISGLTMVMRRPDGTPSSGQIAIQLDARPSPRHFDMIVGSTVTKGLYAVEGDTLTLCYPIDTTGPRPTELAAKPGDRRRFQILKRASASQGRKQKGGR